MKGWEVYYSSILNPKIGTESVQIDHFHRLDCDLSEWILSHFSDLKSMTLLSTKGGPFFTTNLFYL